MTKIFQILAIIAAFSCIAGVSAYTEEENVLVLGDKDLGAALKEYEHVLVEFYAPWCGHCKKLTPEYARAATVLAEQGSKVKLAKVDCTVETETATTYGISGYPTLKFFVNGEPSEYEGGRTEKDILAWLKKKTQPATREVTSSEDLAKETKSNDVVLVYFGAQDSEGYKAYETVSKQLDDVSFVHTSSADIRTEQNVAEGTQFLLLKKFDDGRNELASGNAEELKAFINSNKTPLVMYFDQKAAEKIFGEVVPALMLVYKKNEDGERAQKVLNEAAQKLKGKLQVSLVDINDGVHGPRLSEFIGVTEADTPAFRIIHPYANAAPKKYSFNGEATVENLVQFAEDYTNGKIKPFLKSAAVPATNDEPVKIVVGNNFEELVNDPTKDVFVEFYAPWCGHCKSLAPIWDELAKDLSSIKNLVIAKMDSTENEVESVEISGFPTLKFFPKGNKAGIDYNGERTKEALKNWLHDQVTVEHDHAAFHGEL